MNLNKRRIRADYKQAVGLLRHDLVWSSDLEAIRLPLAELIEFHVEADFYPLTLTKVVRNLIATENDLSI